MQQTDDLTLYIRTRVSGFMQWRRVYETIVERYERAAKFWDERLKDVNTYTMEHSHGPGDESIPTEELQDLLSSVNLDGDKNGNKGMANLSSDTKSSQTDTFVGISFMDKNVIDLYRCSFCGNCSAALRKCSRCGNARYCDANWYVET